MHWTAQAIAAQFFRIYLSGRPTRILEVGSQNINGALRDVSPSEADYTGVDMAAGPGVDVVLADAHALPFPAGEFDAVVSSSCLEHDDMFWLTFLEMARVSKPGGYIYLNAPSNGAFHRHPTDSWQFYPDAANALCSWAGKQGHTVELVESFIARRKDDIWNDCVMVLRVGGEQASAPAERVVDHFPGSYNIRRGRTAEIANLSFATEDMILLDSARRANAALAARVWQLSTPGLPSAPRARIFTTFGTILYVDPAGRLCHGAVDRSPENAMFIADPRSPVDRWQGWLVRDPDAACEPIACLADRCQAGGAIEAGDGAATPTRLTLLPLERGLVAIAGGDLFLCAEPDGRVTLSRPACSIWECFLASESWCTDRAGAGRDRDADATASRIDWTTIAKFSIPAPLKAMARPPSKAGPMPSPRAVTARRPPANGAAATPLPGQFARRRVVVMRHRGNLANKMLQYMGALTLAGRVRDCSIVNVSLPEWGIEIPDDTQAETFFDDVDLWTWDPFRPHVQELCASANRSQSIRITIGDHLQRMEFLMAPTDYDAIFPTTGRPYHELAQDDLVINIRTAEILEGVAHYPLLPIAFYEDIVAASGLNPVFVGQLQDCEYVRRLRSRFPDATFLESRGARADFDLIRSAKHIVVAVSTFSWLAAWLSGARTIYLPLSGFYNPAHHREIDLLPVDDVRYRFFLFPLNYGLPEKESLAHHERLKGHWKEISRSQAALLKSSAPFLRVPRESYDSGLPTRLSRGAGITFDPVWYAHRHIDAAMEISDGWFEDPLHHYLEVGKLRGYLPTAPLQEMAAQPDLFSRNLARGKPATQSSRSQWSKGATVEEDAANAVTGDPSKDYGFHTADDPSPWWLVDLEDVARIELVRIFNREGVPDWMQRRASPLIAEVSHDGEHWTELFRTSPGQLFGGYRGGQPLTWSASEPVEGRFVRLSIPRREYLHLAEVEVYGTPSGDQAVPARAEVSRDAHRSLEAVRRGVARERRVLLFTGVGWAFGSVHFELVKYLYSRGVIADVLDFGRSYGIEEMRLMGEYYDCIVGILGETWPLTDSYGIPHDKIVVIAHGDYDLRHALETRPPDEIERFAGYAVISDYLRNLSADLGIRRTPTVVSYGVNCGRFLAAPSERLATVGYGGSMERKDAAGIDWKRGHLARAATEAAGLVFRPAGGYHFLAMPGYYSQVDAVLVSSLNEGFGLPALEAAAAGRLVISTPVGGFPSLAARGGGIMAPLDATAFHDFVVDKLTFYRDRPSAYLEACRAIQEAARPFDWQYTIDDWIELMGVAGR